MKRRSVVASHMTTRTVNTDTRRAPLGRTVFSRVNTPRPRPSQSSKDWPDDNDDDAAYRRALKEEFQRDLDDTVAQICSEVVYAYVCVYTWC